MKAFVSKIIQNQIYINDNHQQFIAKIKGQLRLNHKLCSGDYIEYEIINNQCLITKIYPYKNYLLRPNVANIDLLIIVQSVIEPDFNELFIEKMLLFYLSKNITKIIIVLTKTDLLDNNQLDKYHQLIKKYQIVGIKIYDINNQNDFNELVNNFNNQIVCLVGNSGVGKSSLINKINPDLNLLTQPISKALNRGKHTTTNCSIIDLKTFYLVDTPGFSSIDINHINQSLIIDYYFSWYSIDHKCKYLNCSHTHENQCVIKQNIDNDPILKWRYYQYLDIIRILNKQS